MAQNKYQAGGKVDVWRGNRKRAVCDLNAEINMNTKTQFRSTPKIFETIEDRTKYPGDEGWHFNWRNDLFLVVSTTVPFE